MLLLRKITFYIFALIYLILCPLIVARMLGFVFNPQTHRLVKTGLVYVSTNPPNAIVYIDGRLAHQPTPTIIRDLTPGKHFIRIEYSGYKDWERDIPIVGKKATVLANILLIPDQWPIRIISTQPYQNITFVDDDVLVATNPTLKNIDIYHASQGVGTGLFSINSVYAAGSLIRFFGAPKSPFVLLEAMINDQHKFLWANVNEDPPLIEDISDLFTAIPTRIAWDNADNDNIFAFYPNAIYRVNIKDKAIYLEDASRLPENLRIVPSPGIQDRFLINDNNDLLIRQKALIRLYPKEDFNTPQVYDIAKSKPLTNMYFEEKTGELFYLEYGTGRLSAAQILPNHPILNIPIPDALKFKTSKEEIPQ